MSFKPVLGKTRGIGGLGVLRGRSQLIPGQRAHGYSRCIPVTIDHTQVGGTDLQDFNIVVRGIFPELASVANGGQIYNTNGFGEPVDLTVAANPDGSGQYDFSLPVWDPATGQVELYFRRPTLSASSDGVFYLVYSDPLQTTWPGSDHFGTHPEWDTYQRAVYHFQSGVCTDQTGSFAHGLPSGTSAVTGVVGDAISFPGGTSVVDVSLAISGFAFPSFPSPITFEFWAQLPASVVNGQTLIDSSPRNFTLYCRGDFEAKGFATVSLFVSGGGEAGIPYPTDNVWHHYMIAVNASGVMSATIDGVQQTITTTTAGSLALSTSSAMKFGNGFVGLVGALDELRFSDIDRISASSIGYAVAVYNNQKSSSTFLTFGSPTGTSPMSAMTDVGALTLTGLAPSIVLGNRALSDVGALNLVGLAPTAQIGSRALSDVGSLILSGFAPTVIVSNNQSVSLGVGALSLTGFAPNITYIVRALTDIGALTLSGFAPVPTLSDNKFALSDVGALSLTGFAPTPTLSDNKFALTDLGSLLLSGFAPTAVLSDNKFANTDVGALTLSGFAPVVVIDFRAYADVGALVLTGFAPVVNITQSALTQLGQLTLDGYAPTVSLSDNKFANTDFGQLILDGLAPTISVTQNQYAFADVGSLLLTGFAPTAALSDNQFANTDVGALLLSGFAPFVSVGDDKQAFTDVGALVLSGFTPSISLSDNQAALSLLGQLVLAGFAPTVVISMGGEDPALSLGGQFYPSSDYY